VTATRTKVTLHDHFPIALRCAIPPVTPVLLELLATPAFRALPWSAWACTLAQRRLVNLHRPHPTQSFRPLKSPPRAAAVRAGGGLRYGLLAYGSKPFAASPSPSDSTFTFRACLVPRVP
jgi:hypothetical protein